MLFNEPKLLKCASRVCTLRIHNGFSALQRAEIAEMDHPRARRAAVGGVSVLFNEPKLLKSCRREVQRSVPSVSVLFNEPKLLKYNPREGYELFRLSFSALQRAEIAEMRGRRCGLT